MSTLAYQLNIHGQYEAFPLPIDGSTPTWLPTAEASLAVQLEEDDDDIDLYYFSSDSDSSISDVTEDAQGSDTEAEEEMMPGGWPAAMASRISSPIPWLSGSMRPQSIIVDGLRITVTLPEDSYDFEDGPCLLESDSAASFFTAAESVMDDIHLLSTSPTRDFLHVPVSVLAPSSSVLVILEEFACSPPLPALSFDDDGEANLWGMSRFPSSASLLTPPESDFLALGMVPSPEFASNFAQAQFPELVCHSFLAPISASPSHYPWFDSFLDQYLGDEEFAGTADMYEASFKTYQCSQASTQAQDEKLPVNNAIVTSDSQESPREPFEELWQCARAGAFTERVTQPTPGPRACDQALEVVTGKACTKICATASAYEMDELLELYAPSEPKPELIGVLPPACPAEGTLIPDEDEEYYRTPSTINLTGAGHHNEKLAKEARETFWEMWTRPSDTDLALFFKRSDDAPSGLHIFVEEDTHRAPLPGSGEVTCSFQPPDRPLDQPLGARERLRQEQRDAFLVLWKESFEQDDL